MRVPVFDPAEHGEEVQREHALIQRQITDPARITGHVAIYAPASSFRRRVPPLKERFVRMMMRDGKKSVSERVLFGALRRVGDRTGASPDAVLALALDNVRPLLETKSMGGSGGRSMQVPVPVHPTRGEGLAMKWLIGAARKRAKGKPMAEKLAAELLDASRRLGAAVKKREETHKDAERNKINAHLRAVSR